jgi:SpoVK/Ycf46/Vps4 family AAA+-type ATPase
MADNLTASQRKTAEIQAHLKARDPILWVMSTEEARVKQAIIRAALTPGVDYPVIEWDCITGCTSPGGKEAGPGREAQDASQVFNYIRDSRERNAFIMKDLHKWLDPTILRHLRNLAQTLPAFKRSEARAIIILTPPTDVPPELVDHVIVIKWELPDRTELGAIFEDATKNLSTDEAKAEATKNRAAIIEAAVGLSATAAESAFSKSIVTTKKIEPAIIATDKKAIIKAKGLEVYDADPRGLDALGGNGFLKKWLLLRRLAFSEEARAFGLPPPKGIFLVGVAGCGKSLTAKCIATAFEVPLLRFDPGATQSKWVGDSQQNIREVFNVADTFGSCVLWLDEAEKAFAGATQGAADGGVSSDALGTFLTWMQERKSNVFVIATANDVSKLPPELLRKGRFDELFFVDLPTQREREAIVAVTLKQYKREMGATAVERVARACRGFTGSEIAAVVPEALFTAFADGKRELTSDDLCKVAATVVPLSKTAAEKIEALRDWAKSRARPASEGEEAVDVSANAPTRALDL